MIKQVLVLLVCGLAVANAMVREGWLDVRVDHFTPRNQETFPMRYYANDEHAYARGPIFIIVGSAGPVDVRYLSHGLFYDIAYLEGAYLFANEMRYFGHSLPVEDASTNNLDFLTIDQAMADLVDFVNYVKFDVVRNPQAKVILLGYGIGGVVASHFRQQFPHLSTGAWISSGPVHADFEFNGYMESLGNTIREFGGSECYGTIFSGFGVAQNLITLDRSELLTEMFHLCDTLDVDDRFDAIAFLLGLQQNIEFEMLHRSQTSATTQMCDVIEDDDFPNSLLALNNWFLAEHEYDTCVDLSFESYMAPLLETDFDHDALQSGLRQRLYLQCTSTGFFPTTDSRYQPFGDQIDSDFYVEVCRRAFGDWIDEDFIREQVDRTNRRFGGNTPITDRVHYTNGDIDPQHVAGILRDLDDDDMAVATLIANAFQAQDLESIDYEYDSPEMIEAKERTRTLIDIWIFEDAAPIHHEA
ncbi:putative serine protease K12H4.7 [Uranotaenia lowii]|uniref:putative serine protease K12H4.7 n=1 Tax=Uranotaenia lowii TaxID=190385 RepID=UPI00247B096C|nr:putative serine protease K12H4.7 [Uranotaenia lowii]